MTNVIGRGFFGAAALALMLAACGDRGTKTARVDTTLPPETPAPEAAAAPPLSEPSGGAPAPAPHVSRPPTAAREVDEETQTPSQGDGANRVNALPDWLRKPTGEDAARYYPERAQRMNVEGTATISCTVNARGTLDNCSVVSETPADQDFGSSALRMSKLFKMQPQTNAEGEPVDGGTVRIPIHFGLPRG